MSVGGPEEPYSLSRQAFGQLAGVDEHERRAMGINQPGDVTGTFTDAVTHQTRGFLATTP